MLRDDSQKVVDRYSCYYAYRVQTNKQTNNEGVIIKDEGKKRQIINKDFRIRRRS